MATVYEVIGVTENKDGTFNAAVRAFDDQTNKTLVSVTIKAADATEFKDKLRPKLQTFQQMENRKQTLLSTARTALTELLAE